MHNGAIMSSGMRYLVDDGRPFPLVRLTGVLDAGTAAAVRSALLDVLARQPEALVVDVTELDVPDPSAVLVLRDIRRDTLHWPAARIVLCDTRKAGADARTADRTRMPGAATPAGGTTSTGNEPPRAANDTPALGLDAAAAGTRPDGNAGVGRDPSVWRETGWPVEHDTIGAFAALGPPRPGSRLSLDLEPAVGAARRSRQMINEACAGWDRPDLAGPACIVVTEMVNNVVAHSRTPMIVLLAVHEDGMSVAVRDRSQAVPTFTGAPAPTSYGGRGMLLIDSVARRWGSLVLTNGKIVWAHLAGETDAQPAGDDRTAARMPGLDRG
jgi:anti-anti-sigma regulatory factor